MTFSTSDWTVQCRTGLPSLSEVEKQLAAINPSKAVGPDGIPGKTDPIPVVAVQGHLLALKCTLSLVDKTFELISDPRSVT